MKNSIVELKDLNFRYMSDDTQVLKDVNLTVSRGEFVGIIGPAGAGKTTLMSCIKGLIPHTIKGKISGSVDVCGMNTRTVPTAEMAEKVGMVMQDPESQIIGLTVAEDMAFGPENFQVDPELIMSKIPGLLDTVRLSGFQNRETYSLSGGQKQRLAIAGSLMSEPELIILDEPTSELDPIGREEVFTTIKTLRDEKQLTVLVVEQAVEELVEVCDRLIVMKDGQIVADDTPEKIFQQVEVFRGEDAGTIPIPQTIELLYELYDKKLITREQISPYEADVRRLLSALIDGEGK